MFSKKEEKTIPCTVEQCESCNKETKRKFIEGDFVFQETSICISCNGLFSIDKNFW